MKIEMTQRGYVEMPDDYDPEKITQEDLAHDYQLQAVSAEYRLAAAVVGAMNDEDRESFRRGPWFNGVSEMCDDGESTELVLDEIEYALERR